MKRVARDRHDMRALAWPALARRLQSTRDRLRAEASGMSTLERWFWPPAHTRRDRKFSMLIQETAPTYGTPSCVECFNSCQAMCQSTCLGYYECYCGCDPHNGQCPIDCQADAGTYCQGWVTAGVDFSCFADNCSTVCCVPSGQSCGTAPGHGCCTGTCTNGTCQ